MNHTSTIGYNPAYHQRRAMESIARHTNTPTPPAPAPAQQPEPQEMFNVDELDCWICPSNPEGKRPKEHYSYLAPVIKCDMDGRHLKHYDTVNEASEELGIRAEFITRVARGERTKTAGFKWEFA